MRKLLPILLLTGCVVMGVFSPTSGEAMEVPSRNGRTWVDIPNPLFRIRVDERGNVTAPATQISVAHSDPDTFCEKVETVRVSFDRPVAGVRPGISGAIGGNYDGFCNFNYADWTESFTLPFRHVTDPDFELRRVRDICRQPEYSKSGWKGLYPFYPVNVYLYYREWIIAVYHTVEDQVLRNYLTQIELTCDPIPCDPLALAQFENQQYAHLPNAKEGYPYSGRLFSGGKNVQFTSSGLPPGLSLRQSGEITGTTYARGDYRISFEVKDLCPWNPSTRTGTALLKVVDPVPPRIASFSVDPRTLPVQGGDVTVTVKATDNLAVYTVTGFLKQPDGRELGVQLPLMTGTPGNGEWKGKFTIPANTGASPLTYAVRTTVVDADANLAESSPITVTVPHDPIPPQVLSFTATPATMTNQGGQLTVTVKAADNVAVQTVTATFVQPGGRQSGIRLPQVAGTPANGEWRTSWNMPMNTGSAPLVYSITVTAADPSNNLSNSQPLTVTVAAMPQSSSPPAPLSKPALPGSPVPGSSAGSPQLLSFVATPAILPAGGGEITMAVRASDDRGVRTVTAILLQPDGRQVGTMPLPLVAGSPINGEWGAKWTVPANSGTVSVTHAIKVTVADAENHIVTSQPVIITVNPRQTSQPSRPEQAPVAPSAPSGLR